MREFPEHAAACWCRPCQRDRFAIREQALYVCEISGEDDKECKGKSKCRTCLARQMIVNEQV